MIEAPWYPIVYVRGDAMTQSEIEDAVATPFMGFNLGSTKIRQRWTGDIQRHVFESPLIRLMKDVGYTDIYQDGSEIPRGASAPAKSVWVYRYYEPASESLGSGTRPEMEDYANGLCNFVERVRDQVCGEDDEARATFRVYLVAHSMGGLIVRCYLQNIAPARGVTPPVDKVFTYATPHGGIDFRWIGNVPSFISANNRDKLNLELAVGGDMPVVLKYGYDRDTPNRATKKLTKSRMTEMDDGGYEFRIPVVQDTEPGLTGTLILRSQPWQ